MEEGLWQVPGRIIMEDISGEEHRHADSKKPNLGFPLGTAFVLLIVLGFSALFSICYHWEKIRSFHSRHASHSFSATSSQQLQPNPPLQIDDDSTSNLEVHQLQSLPVLMPGDEMPKFIAWPSPYVSPALLQSNDDLQT
ncbi:hypothetical protein SUGI_0597160 [Cryptomeria japonica]|uniref:uncharacterized protein At5g65660 n=1 Tax=Cryptomeria japonica TaxID=3369 RepID=UPI002414A2C8|nr:uncharacterized protein At5g65660 [Cryptomeria japonica]GLJ30193.1 hypothetical protein SUGI_0597160 [Cryptomeria japonica]